MSAIETAQWKKVRSMFRNMVQTPIYDIYTPEYCVATGGIKNSFFSFLRSMIREMIHCEVLDEMLAQSLNFWSRSETFTQALIEKIVSGSVFIAPVTDFLKQSVINAVE